MSSSNSDTGGHIDWDVHNLFGSPSQSPTNSGTGMVAPKTPTRSMRNDGIPSFVLPVPMISIPPPPPPMAELLPPATTTYVSACEDFVAAPMDIDDADIEMIINDLIQQNIDSVQSLDAAFDFDSLINNEYWASSAHDFEHAMQAEQDQYARLRLDGWFEF